MTWTSICRAVRRLCHRPALSTAAAVAVLTNLVGFTCLRPSAALLVGWNVGVVVYAALIAAYMGKATRTSIRLRAKMMAQSRVAVIGATALALVAALGAIVVELATARGTPGAGWSATLAGVTLLSSWGFLHLFFAKQYLHDYWLEGRGLNFPGNDSPGFGEFLYFSFTLGMTAQLSDVTTCDARMRQTVLVHGVLSFLYNTSVLAMAVNLAAGLAG